MATQIYTRACIDQVQARRTEVLAEGSKGGESETELVISSAAQGPSKNTIDKDRVDVLLTDDSGNRGN